MIQYKLTQNGLEIMRYIPTHENEPIGAGEDSNSQFGSSTPAEKLKGGQKYGRILS